MYSSSNVPVDKGLGFDFSGISDLIKGATATGLNIYQQQMQLKQIKAMGQNAVMGGYNVPVIGLPSAQMYSPQPTVGRPMVIPSSGGMDLTTMLLIGGAVLVGGYALTRAMK